MSYYPIDLVNYPVFLNTSQAWWGPFSSGGAIYILARATTNVTVYKSINNGATWAIQDSANRPVMAAGDGAGVFYPGSGTVLTVAFSSSTGGVVLSSFNMATDTFGASSAALAGSTAIEVWPSVMAGGAIRVYYRDSGFGNHRARWAEYAGGVWGAATAVSTNLVTCRAPEFLPGTADVSHLFWQTDSGPYSVYYRELSAAGALGAIATVISGASSAVLMGRPSLWGTKIVLPYVRRSGFNAIPAVMYGDPEGAPVWTSEDAAPAVTKCANVFTAVDGATLHMWYLVEDNATIHQIWHTYNAGSGWADPALFLDEASDPILPVPPFSQFVHNLSFTLLPGGIWGGFFGFEIGDGGGGQLCTIFYSQQAPPPVVATRRSRVFYRKPFFPPR